MIVIEHVSMVSLLKHFRTIPWKFLVSHHRQMSGWLSSWESIARGTEAITGRTKQCLVVRWCCLSEPFLENFLSQPPHSNEWLTFVLKSTIVDKESIARGQMQCSVARWCCLWTPNLKFGAKSSLTRWYLCFHRLVEFATGRKYSLKRGCWAVLILVFVWMLNHR